MAASVQSGGESAALPPSGGGEMTALIRLILRDREELLARIFSGRETRRIAGLLLALNYLLLVAYGAIMGLSGPGLQPVASAVKLPLVYLCSLAICLPALFVVNVLMGSRLGILQTAALMLSAMGLNALLLAAFAPIALFFVVTGADYHFLKIMHVGIMLFAGLWAQAALLRALAAMCEHSSIYPRRALRILLLWMIVFGFVGTQMAWTLRPFLCAPDLKFEWVRNNNHGNRNFYQAIWQSMKNL